MLKYLFRATFNDGTSYLQDPKDLPIYSDHGSAFTDIAPRIGEVKTFGLHTYSQIPVILVDLSDGHFEVNGTRVAVQDPAVTPPPGARYSLLYFRRRTMVTSGNLVPDEYHIGMSFVIDGKTHKYTLAIT